MATTTIEVIDTAVKIGLGSIITLLGTLVVTKLNHSHESARERSKRHYDALEDIASNIEEVTHVSLRYWALIIEWVRNKNQGMGLTEKRKEELEKTKLDLFDQFKNLTIAESKLLLLGLQEPSTLIREYGEFLTEMRRQYYDGKKSITEDDMISIRKELLSKRQTLFNSLSSSYNGNL